MSNLVRVVDSLSGTSLFETTIEKIDDAYAFATQMEEAGLDIKIKSPSLGETLIHSLGADEKDIEEYKQSMEDEIEDHDDADFGCTVCPPSPRK